MAQKSTDNTGLHEHKKLPPPHTGRIALIIVIVAGIMGGWGIASRLHADSRLKEDTKEQAIPVVTVQKAATNTGSNSEVTLPGNLHAWHEASIYARVSGYLKEWHKDIGDAVKAGDVLAEIDTPELDSQLRQVEADLNLAAANSMLAQTTAKRWKDLRKSEAVTQQETDEKIADAVAKVAALQSAMANRDRLKELQGFKQLIAPYDGIVTARNTDVGSLINEGSSGNSEELFHVATVDKLRVYVNVPESYRAILTPDLVAELHFSEQPGKSFPAKYLTSANAYDPSSRMVLVQFELDNPDNLFYPGSYTEVHLKNAKPGENQAVRLPVNAFLFKASNLQVGIVGQDNKVTLKNVTVGHDYGNELEIVAGVNPGDQVIINPPDSLYNGEEVHIATPAEVKAKEEKKEDKKDGQPKQSADDKAKNTSDVVNPHPTDAKPANNAGPQDKPAEQGK